MESVDLGIEPSVIADFCRRWKIKQLAVFGSAAEGVLRPDSDIDLLVTFDPDADWTMFDHYRMENELAELFAIADQGILELDFLNSSESNFATSPITRN